MHFRGAPFSFFSQNSSWNFRGFVNLSKLPENQFPPSFWPPTSLLLKRTFIIFQSLCLSGLPISRATDWPTLLISSAILSHSPTDRPTDGPFCHQCHLFPDFWQPLVRILRHPGSLTVRPTDKPTIELSVGVPESAIWGYPVWVSIPARPPTDGSTRDFGRVGSQR